MGARAHAMNVFLRNKANFQAGVKFEASSVERGNAMLRTSNFTFDTSDPAEGRLCETKPIPAEIEWWQVLDGTRVMRNVGLTRVAENKANSAQPSRAPPFHLGTWHVAFWIFGSKTRGVACRDAWFLGNRRAGWRGVPATVCDYISWGSGGIVKARRALAMAEGRCARPSPSSEDSA